MSPPLFNESYLDARDAQWGACCAAALFPLFSSQALMGVAPVALWQTVLFMIALGLSAALGDRFGQVTHALWAGVAEFLFRSPGMGEKASQAAPFFFAASGAWFFGVFLEAIGTPLFRIGLFQAVLGASVAAWVAAGLGRAVGFASDENPRVWLGSLVAAIGGAGLGSLMAFLLTAATSNVFDRNFFSFWACSGGAAACAATLAAAHGAWQPLAQEP